MKCRLRFQVTRYLLRILFRSVNYTAPLAIREPDWCNVCSNINLVICVNCAYSIGFAEHQLRYHWLGQQLE